MSSIRILSLTAVLALGACVSPPADKGPVVRKTDTTPAPRNVWVESTPAEAPVQGATETTPAPTSGTWGSQGSGARSGGSVREMVESYPVQK